MEIHLQAADSSMDEDEEEEDDVAILLASLFFLPRFTISNRERHY